MADIVSAYWATPPVARTVSTLVFASSVAVYTGMVSMEPFLFHYMFLLKFPPGIHRLVTSFLVTGPQLGVIFDTYFLYTYLSQLEKTNSKFTRKEDLIWYLTFVGSFIIIINQLWTGAPIYLQALMIAMCYTAVQDARGQQAHFYVVTVPAQLMPYCLLLVNLMLAGWYSFQVGLTGIVAAHLHDFLTRLYPEFGNGVNLIPTPWFISYIMRTPHVQNTVYGSATVPPRLNEPRSGPLPDSWRSAGPGRRLG
ncbi:Der1-like family protein [Pseudomassariella vexata]|uniref:Derlin n=1 Tax=Pseudomassariella vexata TaxID=1141098 RepID=A0A1Y2EIX2_9PEZI|nr:Der1-like family protein [Pseudomassariella vexata]ORY71513.1 Der1-like family protein [Pseudomassariella vexata]